jgi:hypothetical protein
MAFATTFDKSIQVQYGERNSQSEEKGSECQLANLMSRSLSMYVELEKIHWYLRLAPAADAVNLESARPMKIAREASTISLQLVSLISRLERILQPNVSPECAAMSAAVEEKIAEICVLASEEIFDFSQHAATLTFQGLGGAERRFRDTGRSENANIF